MKILVLIDRKGWAYHRIALALKRNTDLDITIMPVKNNSRAVRKVYKKYDRFLMMAYHLHGEAPFIPKDLVGIHSFHSWDNRESTPDWSPDPPERLLEVLSRYRGVNVISKRLAQKFAPIHPTYTPNGVDTTHFRMLTIPGAGPEVVVGSTSTKKHDWRKGISEIILPASKIAGLRADIAWQNRDHDEMLAFYNNIDVYVCASLSEGLSLGLLEAGACGRTLVSTRVSGTEELSPVLTLVDRTPEAVAAALTVKRAHETRKFVTENYSWEKVIGAWKDFLTA